MPLSSAGISKQNRLLNPAAFKAVLQGGKRRADALLSVHVRRNNLRFGRLGVAVSRRVSTKAVTRNRIRRQVRESFRLNKDLLVGLDIVVVARSASATQSARELRTALSRHWETFAQECKNCC